MTVTNLVFFAAGCVLGCAMTAVVLVIALARRRAHTERRFVRRLRQGGYCNGE